MIDVTAGSGLSGRGYHGGGEGFGRHGTVLAQLANQRELQCARDGSPHGFAEAYLRALPDQDAGAKKVHRFEWKRANRFLQLGFVVVFPGRWSQARPAAAAEGNI